MISLLFFTHPTLADRDLDLASGDVWPHPGEPVATDCAVSGRLRGDCHGRRQRGLATRNDKTATSHLAGLHLRGAVIWIRSRRPT